MRGIKNRTPRAVLTWGNDSRDEDQVGRPPLASLPAHGVHERAPNVRVGLRVSKFGVGEMEPSQRHEELWFVSRERAPRHA